MKCLVSLLCLLLLISFSSLAQKNIRVSSPDGNIVFNLKLLNTTPYYSIVYKNKTLIDYSPLTLDFENGAFRKNIKFNKPIFKDTTEQYNLLLGKTSHVVTHYKVMLLQFEEIVTPKRKINITVRVFNDGLAFRYEFPQQQNWTSFQLLDENTTFKLSGDPTVRTLLLPNYTSSHEGFYTVTPFSKLTSDTLMDMPTLFEYPGNTYMAITEAALLDYAGMYLSKHNDTLVAKLSPLPKQTAIKVKGELPHKSPWRVMLISDRIGALIESNIITSLNEPSEFLSNGS